MKLFGLVFWSLLALHSTNAIEAESYSSSSIRKQENGGARTLQSSPFTGKITMLNLVDASNDVNISRLVNNMMIPINRYDRNAEKPTFNINATVSGPVKSVLYSYNTTRVHKIENGAPFAFCGNSGPNFYVCNKLGFGMHTVTATPYAELNARGRAGTPVTVSFEIRPPDKEEPKMVSFTLTPSTIDLANSDATVNVEFTLQDASGIQGATLNIFPEYGKEIYFFPLFELGELYEYIPSPVVGPGLDKPVSFQVPVTFPRYLAPGLYEANVLFADTAQNFIRQALNITVTNSNPDRTAPDLILFKPLFNHTINSSGQQVKFEMIVQDDLAGIVGSSPNNYVFDGNKIRTRLTVKCTACDLDWDGEYVYRRFETNFLNQTLAAGQNHTLMASLTISDESFREPCEIQVMLLDRAENHNSWGSDELEERGFPGFLTTKLCGEGE